MTVGMTVGQIVGVLLVVGVVLAFAAAMPDLSASGGSVMPGPRRVFCQFQTEPVTSKRLGGAVTGATGDVNEMLLGGHGLVPSTAFEWHVKGTQTILAPVKTAVGLDLGMDQTNADGLEVTCGILYRASSPVAFKVGTDGPFFVRVRVKLADTSGANPFLVGFRKCEAYQATDTAYADYAAVGTIGTANPNTIKTRTELAGAGNTDTDTLLTWADAATKDLLVKVDGSGNVTWFLSTDNAATWTQLNAATAFAFAAGAQVCPYIYYLHGADVCDTIELIEFECGLQ